MKFVKKSRIEEAKASEPTDRNNILHLVLEKYWLLNGLNNTVDKLLREWLLSILRHERDTTCNDSIIEELNDLALAKKCIDMGEAFKPFGTNLDEALEMFQKSLVIRERKLGNDHTDTANSYKKIGIVMRLKGDFDGALDMFQKSLVIRQNKLGNGHPDTANSYTNIGLLLVIEKHDFDGALDMFKKSLAIRQNKLGNDHPDTANSYNNIGLAMFNKGDIKGALTMYQKSLAICENKLGNDDPRTILVKLNIKTIKICSMIGITMRFLIVLAGLIYLQRLLYNS